VQEPDRREPPPSGSERELLGAFLDFHRDTLLWKVTGLTDEQLKARRTPSGMSLLGLVKHLAYVERSWFQRRFLGQDVYIPWRSGDPDGDFRIEPGDTFDTVVAFYKAEVETSRRIAAAASLDTIARDADPPRSLRWIMIHMIEETARHNGHADLMRELADGKTGE
jgi:uncharacterized damage-inducible protein DinB